MLSETRGEVNRAHISLGKGWHTSEMQYAFDSFAKGAKGVEPLICLRQPSTSVLEGVAGDSLRWLPQECERGRTPIVRPGVDVVRDVMLIPGSPSERGHYLSFFVACLHFQTDVMSDYFASSLKDQKKWLLLILLFKILLCSLLPVILGLYMDRQARMVRSTHNIVAKTHYHTCLWAPQRCGGRRNQQILGDSKSIRDQRQLKS